MFELEFGSLFGYTCVVEFQRNLDQLEALSKKLKAKTVRTEAPSQSIAATRYPFIPLIFTVQNCWVLL